MAQFIMLMNVDASGAPATPSPEEMQAVVEKYRVWAEEMATAGKLAGGEKLSADRGRFLRSESGKVVTLDGPFSETKEMVAGYFVIEAGDYDEAVELSKSCPHLSYGGTIELRQIDNM